ncbi:MAG: hypothetical protein ACK4N4_01220 [Burkholderiales bacterium]
MPGEAASPALAPQSTSEASVTVKITPRTLSGATWDFDVAFDTHSQALNDDLEKTAVLVADGGASQTPVKWQGDPPGGHHRSGTLRFKAVSPLPAVIELRITRQGETRPRTFRWQLK